MITKIKIENFKSIGSPGLDIELKPLTILVGPNGSGKSNIMQALALLDAKAGSSFDRIEDVDIPVTVTSELLDLTHKRNPRKWVSFEIHVRLEAEDVKYLSLWLENVDQQRLGIEIPSIKTIGYRFSWRTEQSECRQSVFIEDQEIVTVAHLFSREDRRFINTFEFPKELIGQVPEGTPTNPLFPQAFKRKGESAAAKSPTNLAQEIVMIMLSKVVGNVSLLSALRGEVPYAPKTERPPKWVGMKGEDVVHILSLLGQRRYKKKREKVMKWASRFGLVDISGTWSSWDRLVSDFADPYLDTALNSALASHGSKQILSVIVQLFWTEPHNLIMIEEPEISLHPDAQASLPELFAEAVSEGKQIVITTHSEFLLLAMSSSVRRKLIRPEDIVIYHVTKDSKGTHAKPLEVTPEGYVKGWVPSFAEIEQKLLKEWLQTIPEDE